MVEDYMAHTITERLAAIPAYREASMRMPVDPADIWGGWQTQLSEAALREVFDALRDEVPNLDFATWRTLSQQRFIGLDEMHPLLGEIQVRGFLGSETYLSWYPITTLTPTAAEIFLRHVNLENFEQM